MANLRIGYLNYADLAVLSATPIMTAATPVAYLQNNARGDVVLASSVASQIIQGTWNGTAYTLSQLTLWRHNLAAADTIRLQLYSDAAWTTQVYDSTALAAYASGLFDNWGWGFYNFYFTPQSSIKSFRITVAASATPFQCSRLYLGPYTEATFNAKYGFVLGLDSNSVVGRTRGGSLRSTRAADWRTATFDMEFNTEADRAAWFEIDRYCSNSRSLVASLFPGVGGTAERDHTLFGMFDKPPGVRLAGVNRYDHSLKILEL